MTQLTIGSVSNIASSQGYLSKETLEDQIVELSLEQLHQLHEFVTRLLVRGSSATATTCNQNEAKNIQCLTAREREVLTFVASGYTRPEVAFALRISRNTAATHIASIYRKLEIGSIAEATMLAIRWGFVA